MHSKMVREYRVFSILSHNRIASQGLQISDLLLIAGLPVQSLRGSRTAVFSATMADDYSRMTSKDFDMAPRNMVTALQPSILPNRVSWYFDLCGPSAHIDTACSGTLTALDIACQTMRSGNASMVRQPCFYNA